MMKRTRKPINNIPKETDPDMIVLEDLQERLQAGANNPNLKTAELLLTKKQIDVLYGVVSATINYHKMTKG